MNYFEMDMDPQALQGIGVLGLAHVGDAVYDLLVRTMLVSRGHGAVGDLHRRTVSFVKAEAQAAAAQKLLPLLTEEEVAVYKRGRNAHVNTVPHHAAVGDYHAATGLETLFGHLYLRGERERLLALFAAVTEA